MPKILLPPGLEVFERGWLSANNIFIYSKDGASIIDTGYHCHASMTLSLVQHELNKYHLARISTILNTHLHSDHCGGNHLLQERFNPDTYIPATQAQAVQNWDAGLLSFEATGQQCPRFSYTHTLSPGQVIGLGNFSWKVLAAPGHDPDSIMFFENNHGILISADALWEKGFGVVFPELLDQSGFEEVACTIDLIASLKPDLVIPGHGRPFKNINEAIEVARSKLDYLSSDPKRNARHGAKVLLKYKLLEWQKKDLRDVVQWVYTTPLMNSIAKQLNYSIEELTEWLLPALCKTGGALIDGDLLVNQD